MKKLLALFIATLLLVGLVTPAYAHEDENSVHIPVMVVVQVGSQNFEGSSIMQTLSANSTCYFSPRTVTGIYIEHRYGTHTRVDSSWGEFIWEIDTYLNGHYHSGSLTVDTIDISGGHYTCGNCTGIGTHEYEYDATGRGYGRLTCTN